MVENESDDRETRIEVPENSGLYVRINSPDDAREKNELHESAEENTYGVSAAEKRILIRLLPPEPSLPFPLKKLKMWKGQAALEYEIPDEKKAEILEALYPFIPCPGLDEQKYDIHANKTFVVRDYRVIREFGRNMLVSPYYPEAGGMVVDWMEVDNVESCTRKCRKC